jgi:hypothetical protein
MSVAPHGGHWPPITGSVANPAVQAILYDRHDQFVPLSDCPPPWGFGHSDKRTTGARERNVTGQTGYSFFSKESQLTWRGSFPPTRLPQNFDRPRPALAGAPRPHRVAGRWARSARQNSRDGLTGGIGLGSTVLGSRDLVQIIARSRQTGTLRSTLGFEPPISW